MAAVSTQDQKIKVAEVRTQNYRLMMKTLLKNGTCSVNDITGEIGVSKTTIGKLIRTLMEKELLRSEGKGDSTQEGGKKPVLYSMNPQYTYFAAVRYSNIYHFADCTIYDLALNPVCSSKAQISNDIVYRSFLDIIADLVRKCAQKAGISLSQLYSTAMCGSGICDALNGICIYAAGMNWEENRPIRKDLQELLGNGIRVFFDNGCHYLGLAEIESSTDPVEQNSACIYIAGAVGGAVLKDGQLLAGKHGVIGEMGYLLTEAGMSSQGELELEKQSLNSKVDPERLLQSAYCLPEEVVQSSILKTEIEQKTLTPQDIFDAANREDAAARRLLDPVICNLAAAIHNMAYCYDIRRFILQGIYDSAGPYFIEELNRYVNSGVTHLYRMHIRIRYSSMDFADSARDNFLFGAAIASRNTWLSDLEISE